LWARWWLRDMSVGRNSPNSTFMPTSTSIWASLQHEFDKEPQTGAVEQSPNLTNTVPQHEEGTFIIAPRDCETVQETKRSPIHQIAMYSYQRSNLAQNTSTTQQGTLSILPLISPRLFPHKQVRQGNHKLTREYLQATMGMSEPQVGLPPRRKLGRLLGAGWLETGWT